MDDTPRKPILCLDFDGCIHSYTRGWQDGAIYDPVVPGFFEWALEAQKLFKLVVYSSRSKHDDERMAMVLWFEREFNAWGAQRPEQHKLAIEFAHEKPAAFLTIDDRAIQFRGEWQAWWLRPERLTQFRPWMARGEETRDVLP